MPVILRYRQELAEVLLASRTLHLLGLETPMLSQIIIDKAIVHGNLPTLNVMAIALCCIVVVQAILGILRIFIFSHTTKRLALSLTAQLFNHLLKLSLAYFEQRRVGDTIARVGELDGVLEFLTGTALTVVIDAVFSTIDVIWMLVYSPKLTRKSEILALTYQGTIESPMNGTVYNIKVDESGVAVQAGDEVLSILPDGQELMLKAKLLNQDKGFVYQGMKVKIKLTTFPYQEFGTLEGTVVEISPNAVDDQKLGPVFPVHVKLHQHSVQVRGEDKQLTPGMDARAELITRRRTILSYLFDPIISNWDDAFSAR